MYPPSNSFRPTTDVAFGGHNRRNDIVSRLKRRGVRIDPDSPDARKVKAYVRQHPEEFKPLLKRLKLDQFQAEVKRINRVAQKDSTGRRLGLEVRLVRDAITRHKRPVLEFLSLAGHAYDMDFLDASRRQLMKQLKEVRSDAELDAKYIYVKTADRNEFFEEQRRRQQLHEGKYLLTRPVPPRPVPVPMHHPLLTRPVPLRHTAVPISRPKKPLYLAYGSNLNWNQLKARCPDAVPIRPATLKGWRVVYVGHSYNWNGAVASLKHTNNPNDVVKGVLFKLSESDKANLDRFEGLGRAYRHKEGLKDENGEFRIRALAQTTTNGKKVPIFTYDRVALGEPEIKPSATYLKVIVEGLKYWSEKYPQFGWANYIQKMSQVNTNGQIVPEIERRLLSRIV